MPELLRESTAMVEAMKPVDGPGRFEILLITPGWGSSGYYSEAALKQAATDKVWPAGTQQHIDHQTAEERAIKPEGSVQTLASVLMEDARWSDDVVDPKTGKPGGLVAEAKVFSRWRKPLAEMAEHIGVSIVAPADMTIGEAEGRQGRIVERLYPDVLNRADYVTHAGRGGQATVIESAALVTEARNVGQWLEARMHSSFTGISDEMYGDGRLTREERITLSSALGAALTAFTSTVDSQAPQLFERDLWEEPPAPTATESITAALTAAGFTKESADHAVKVILTEDGTPKNVTANPGQTRQTPQEGNNMAEVMIESSRLEQLEESHGRVQTLAAERDAAKAEVTEARRAQAVAESTVRARDFAATLVRTANSELSESVVGRIVNESVAVIPLTDDLRLDTDALTESVTRAREAEETYIARIAKENGLGSVRGVGASDEQDDKPTITVESARADVLRSFGRTPKK